MGKLLKISPQKIDYNITQLVNLHKRKKDIISFCIIGSYVKHEIDTPNDIDCLIITKKKFSDRYIVNKILSLSCFDVCKKSDDIFILSINRVNFNLAYFYEKYFYEYISELIDGSIIAIEQKPWVIGGKIPEIFLGDIKSAQIIFDKNNHFIALQKFIKKQYPLKLKKTLLNYIKNEVINKIILINYYLKQKDYFLFYLGVYEIAISIIRYIYVSNDLFLLPIKHVTRGVIDGNLSIKYQRLIKQLFITLKIKQRIKVLNNLKIILKELNIK